MDVKNYFCPVCGNDFNDGDDVVFCPECGTPHHRECWKEIGRCVNQHFHNSGEPVDHTYKRENVPVEPVFQSPENTASVNGENGGNPLFTRLNEPYESGGASAHYIDGNPVYLYEIGVGKNQEYYIPRFILMDKTKKSISWNFVGFIFPLAWSLYRKMYKLAAIVFAIYIALFSFSAYFVYTNDDFVDSFIECYEEDPEFFQNVSLAIAGEDTILTVKQQKFIAAYNSIEIPIYVQGVTFVLTYGIKALVSLKGNSLYFKKLSKSINKGSEKGLTGDNLKNFMYKKNGVLPLFVAILIGIFEWGI